MKQQRGFIAVLVGLFSLLLLASMTGILLDKVTAKSQPKTAAATFSLAGQVRLYCPQPCRPPGSPPLPGVTITFTRVSGTGFLPLPVQTDADGRWNQAGFEDGTTYRVTPSGLANTYLPAYQDVSKADDQIFFSVAPPSYTISGRVTLNGEGMDGVTINIESKSLFDPLLGYNGQTDANGNWSVSGVKAGVNFYTISPFKPGYVFTPCPRMSPPDSNQSIFEASPASLVTVSSADFNNRLGFCSYTFVAQESIVSAFGTNLATTTQSATSQPLPTELAGTSVKLKDAANTERDAPLFFVSPSQINFQIPPGTIQGTASITVVHNGAVANQGNVNITDFQLALFTADASGKGFPAAVAYRLKANGAESYEPIARFDSVQGKLVAVPIEFGDETEQLFLVLFGTGGIAQIGVGANTHTDLQSYEITIGGTPAQVTYVGLQPSYVGLVQTNVLLPRGLIGRGETEIKLRAIGREANPVTINIH